MYNTGPDGARYEEAVGWTGLVNGSYNLVTIFGALFLMGLAARLGAKWIHAATLTLAGLGLIWFSQYRQPVHAVRAHDRARHRLSQHDGLPH